QGGAVLDALPAPLMSRRDGQPREPGLDGPRSTLSRILNSPRRAAGASSSSARAAGRPGHGGPSGPPAQEAVESPRFGTSSALRSAAVMAAVFAWTPGRMKFTKNFAAAVLPS